MANIKSAEKRNRQRTAREARNRIVRGRARTAVKNARTAIDRGEANAAALVQIAEKELDKAASKGVIHENNASRRKSRLYQALNRQQAAA